MSWRLTRQLRTPTIIAALCLLSSLSLSAQEEIFLSTLNGELYSLDLENCDYEFVALMPVSSTDISFHPNGNFYALGSAGQLYEIDLDNNNSQLIHTFQNGPNQLFTALTISAQGIFYACGLNGDLWSYEIATGVGQFLGNVGSGAEGDLTFYEGDLFMAAAGDNIVRINLQNPALSTIVIDENVMGRIFGIVSYAASCDSISVYALTDNAATVFEVDLINNELEFYCSIPLEVSGGASTFEFLGSNPINIGEPEADDFSCSGNTGILDIPATGGVGNLQYSLDGTNFQDSPVFTDLPLDNYTIFVSDEVGCVRSRQVSPNGGPLSTAIDFSNTSCGENNGSITLSPTGGEAPYLFSLNDTLQNNDGIFTVLPPGDYAIIVTEANGCQFINNSTIQASVGLSIDRLESVPATCGLANGEIILEGTGGSEPYDIRLNGAPLAEPAQLTQLPAGDYRIEVIDNEGCVLEVDATVGGGPAVEMEVIELNAADCGKDNGSAIVALSGGSGPLRLRVNNLTRPAELPVEGLAAGNSLFSGIDSLGCTISLNILVPSNNCPLYFPTAFSPNLDGVNDYFQAYGPASAQTQIVHFRIFDRWGGLLYEQLDGPLGDPAFRWDGTAKGKAMNDGIYLYAVKVLYEDGSSEEISGAVNLLR